jgi:DNA sulfur modification protein DndB
MKIPAIRAKIGTWDYYVTTLTFEQVSNFVSKIDEHLHKSESLSDLIQRSITNNFISIKDYIVNQPEVFFGSLVLAVYDDYPEWRGIEFKYDNEETYQMGLLEFPTVHKIFPVDGQHRVEGIKAALKEHPELASQRISAIFIGHKNDEAGKQKTRRLFTTLNRYAKPVSLDDIIALDEDDIVAITTRYLLEEYDLFTGKRVVYAKQKAIPSNNKDAITSIITLYQANYELFRFFFEEKFEKRATKNILDEYLKFRPVTEDIESFISFSVRFWDAFKQKISCISVYLNESLNPAESFRNNDIGGNLIFRPIGFLPIVKVSLSISRKEGKSFDQIFEALNTINLNIDSKPWQYVVWNPIQKKMIMNSDSLTQLLLMYLYDEDLLTASEIKKLREGYASRISYEDADLEHVLDGIK